MNNISKFRNQIGLTQAQLAEHLGWSQPRIANYETGVRKPSLFVAREIVAGLNRLGCKVSLDDVFPLQQ
ncbi:helix-turn-helix transcriptional regulator [Avibacterium paragallinarum]|uniref:Cro repressor n=1 Tax=Avibacterium paragallinarum TaxID=728 RepID=A0A377I945_AVIPA|nr:helix-turn-helix transcriptional regulator [Avibacterium paragallinarum]POY47696.1 XRE family transcriptional regulator [Avibacterium paragallinarum]RZN73308.1 XRE family transcriptional regulator [Avibacterium paragallinarum]STO71806.1 cro repressor [Avibacterium paragallinarum]